MKSKLIYDENGLKTWVLVFDKNDEVKKSLLRLASENRLRGAQIIAIGAFSEVTLGFFDREKNSYQEIPIKEQVEVLSFVGNIAEADGNPKLHAHVVIGKRDGTAHGGHLLNGRVWPTLEMIVAETPAHFHRRKDEDTGLPLIDLPS